MSTSAELLRMLGSVAAPAPASKQPSSPSSGIDFASLLKQAGEGGLSSGLPVTVARGAKVQLSPEQLTRIAAAADRAEAQGATRALVMIDGKALTLDVAVRQVTGEADLRGGGVLTGMDAVISIPSGTSAGRTQPGILPLPRSGYANPSLLRALAPPNESDPAA